MSEPDSPGESRRGAPRFFVGYEDDESEAPDESMRTDMELYEDDEDTDSVRRRAVCLKNVPALSQRMTIRCSADL